MARVRCRGFDRVQGTGGGHSGKDRTRMDCRKALFCLTWKVRAFYGRQTPRLRLYADHWRAAVFFPHVFPRHQFRPFVNVEFERELSRAWFAQPEEDSGMRRFCVADGVGNTRARQAGGPELKPIEASAPQIMKWHRASRIGTMGDHANNSSERLWLTFDWTPAPAPSQ